MDVGFMEDLIMSKIFLKGISGDNETKRRPMLETLAEPIRFM